MPPGSKKKKSSKRKNHKMAVHDHQQGNGREKRQVVIEDEGDETFETPRFQPEMSSYSMEKLKIGRIDEVEESRIEPQTPYYSMENMEIGKKDETEGSSEVDVIAGEKLQSLVAESSKESKLVESENCDASEDGEKAQKDVECFKETKFHGVARVSDKESSVEKDMTLKNLEKPVSVKEKTPNVSIEAVDGSSSNERELKVVPWPDEDVAAINGNVNGDGEIVASEKGGDGDENKQHTPAAENSRDVVESVRTLPQINVNLINNNLDNFMEKSSLLVENSVLITEEEKRGSKVPEERPENSVGVSNPSPHGGVKEVAKPSFDGGKIGISERKQIARDPAPVRHASIWNCCGLFEVLTSSDR
ncbi:uncharacterized protein A4U43_C05F27330 [Asparagus officinalis]|uniref:Uncharacterized protein n=1 Tax=Asparagus officinalis TaxID=4686 RepID=A0A5P1EUW2_ASPOF|nr:uncharacterized protein LOC109840672 [Asparagus officinalis]XP_020264990.1 uncharacterized protein LOC109840672 [Asparagus officinalis]XP_020264991.1 uncharacterized protein LOC109840672 [Asparagus officinalis]ONK69845.1 uncharacterized protein A4U43_C05F27330 [Asparagus officinalis]